MVSTVSQIFIVKKDDLTLLLCRTRTINIPLLPLLIDSERICAETHHRLLFFTMFIEKERHYQDQLSLSHYFELTCESILEQLQLILPCQQWLIAYKEHDQWCTLYANPVDGIDKDKLILCFDQLHASGQTHDKRDVFYKEASFIGATLEANDSVFSGVICGYRPAANGPLAEKFSHVHLFAKIISYQLETEFKLNHQKYKIQQLINLSHTDSLTQLLNHRAWSQLLTVEEARAKRYQQAVTIFIIDLDKLKVVNDTQGHHAGDVLIVKAANCLRDVCRESDLVARLGGDEFGLLALECDEAGAQVLLQNIYDAFDESSIDASVGYCVMIESLSILEAVNIADKKMYKNKNHKNGHTAKSIRLGTDPNFTKTVEI